MAINHGITITENPTSFDPPVEAKSGIPIIIGTAPVNLTATPADAYNKAILISNFEEAKSMIGHSTTYASYTICQAIDAYFGKHKVGPGIAINVLDPANDTTAVADAAVSIVVNKATIAVEGILLASVVVSNAADDTVYDIDDDYTLSFDGSGHLVIKLVAAGQIVTDVETSLTVDYTKLNPAAITSTEIIAGLALIDTIYQTISEVPGLIIAPGWSHLPAVGQAMIAECVSIGGLFNCTTILDVDTATVTAYTGVKTWKDTNLYNDSRATVCWPMLKTADGTKYYFSAMQAALMASVDGANDGVPYASPSNKSLNVAGAVLASDTEVFLTITQANEVNAAGVVTALKMSTWRSWGNYTGGFPEVTDPKDYFISNRRVFDYLGNTFIQIYFDKVDDPLNNRLIESIVDDENIRLNGFKALGQLAGARIEYRAEDNPAVNLAAGRLKVRTFLTPYAPAQDIENIQEFDISGLTA